MNDELEKQYLLYLEKAELNIKKMPLSQQIELERAFMGACSQILFLFFEKHNAYIFKRRNPSFLDNKVVMVQAYQDQNHLFNFKTLFLKIFLFVNLGVYPVSI